MKYYLYFWYFYFAFYFIYTVYEIFQDYNDVWYYKLDGQTTNIDVGFFLKALFFASDAVLTVMVAYIIYLQLYKLPSQETVVRLNTTVFLFPFVVAAQVGMIVWGYLPFIRSVKDDRASEAANEQMGTLVLFFSIFLVFNLGLMYGYYVTLKKAVTREF